MSRSIEASRSADCLTTKQPVHGTRLGSATGALLARFRVSYLVPIVTAFSGALTGWMEFRDLDRKLERYSKVHHGGALPNRCNCCNHWSCRSCCEGWSRWSRRSSSCAGTAVTEL